MKKGATFSPCRKYRYLLWRRWDERKLLFVIGLNPSTADEEKDDPTIRRCIRYAKDWGYGGLMMGNIFAYRATNPKEMKAQRSPIGRSNNWHLINQNRDCGLTLAAWGTNGKHLNRDMHVEAILENLRCLEITKDGFPKHPLYCRADLRPIKYL